MVGPTDRWGVTSSGIVRERSGDRINRFSKNDRNREVTGAFKTLPFYLLTLGSMCSIAAVSGTQQNLKLFLSLDRHFTQSDAARVLSLVLSFSMVGRLLMGGWPTAFQRSTRCC